jgi:hypothetical protein
VLDLAADRERQRIARGGVEQADHAQANSARAVGGDGVDARFETVAVVDFGEAGIDADVDAALVGFGGLVLRLEHAIDQRAVDIERIAGDDRAARHVEGELAFEDIARRILERDRDGGFGNVATYIDIDVERGDAKIALVGFAVDTISVSDERWAGAVLLLLLFLDQVSLLFRRCGAALKQHQGGRRGEQLHRQVTGHSLHPPLDLRRHVRLAFRRNQGLKQANARFRDG